MGCWWEMTGSNRRPPACKADALPAELISHGMVGDNKPILHHEFGGCQYKCVVRWGVRKNRLGLLCVCVGVFLVAMFFVPFIVVGHPDGRGFRIPAENEMWSLLTWVGYYSFFDFVRMMFSANYVTSGRAYLGIMLVVVAVVLIVVGAVFLVFGLRRHKSGVILAHE